MSSYNKAPVPFKPVPVLAVSGRPTYLWGSWDDKSAPTQGTVISNSASGTTATLVFQILSGNIPLVGDLITVISSANSGGVFNVTNAVLVTVSCTIAGVCTVTYTIASTSQVSTPDVGQVLCPRSEIGETFANGASAPVSVAPNNSAPQQGRTLTLSTTVTGSPSTGLVDLQGANQDIDSQYETLAPIAGGSVSGHAFDATTQTSSDASYADYTMNYRFYRVINSSVTGGTNPTIISKLEN